MSKKYVSLLNNKEFAKIEVRVGKNEETLYNMKEAVNMLNSIDRCAVYGRDEIFKIAACSSSILKSKVVATNVDTGCSRTNFDYEYKNRNSESGTKEYGNEYNNILSRARRIAKKHGLKINSFKKYDRKAVINFYTKWCEETGNTIAKSKEDGYPLIFVGNERIDKVEDSKIKVTASYCKIVNPKANENGEEKEKIINYTRVNSFKNGHDKSSWFVNNLKKTNNENNVGAKRSIWRHEYRNIIDAAMAKVKNWKF